MARGSEGGVRRPLLANSDVLYEGVDQVPRTKRKHTAMELLGTISTIVTGLIGVGGALGARYPRLRRWWRRD